VGSVFGKKGYPKTFVEKTSCKLFTRKYKKVIELGLWDTACDDGRQMKLAQEC
jgi:hypothetical protein